MTSLNIWFRHSEESTLRPGKEEQNPSEDEEMKSSVAEELGNSNEAKLKNDIQEVENVNKPKETV